MNPLFELLSLPPAIWHPGDPRSWWRFGLPWVLPPVLALGPLCSTLKWNVCPLSSMPSTTLSGGVKRREAGVNVTVELFQLSLEPADDQGMCHESCRWQRPMWVWTWGEEPSLEGRTPELSEPALTHISDLLDDLGIHYEYRWLRQEDKVLW